MEFKSQYQAFNMSFDYKALVNCPYGCLNKLREEQLLLHITKCYKKNDELFGHCKYNYLHIYPHELISSHEQHCPSNIPMTEEDFAYKPEPTNLDTKWIQEDELSAKYAKYFIFETLPVTVEGSKEEEQSNHETDQEQETIQQLLNTKESDSSDEKGNLQQDEISNSQKETSQVSEAEEFTIVPHQESPCLFLNFIRRFVQLFKKLW